MSNTFLEAIQAIEPGARGTSRNIVRKQRDTIEEARAKTVTKLNQNIAFVSNGMTAENGESVDPVFIQDNDGTFLVGAKYGNRWLQNLVAANEKKFDGISQANLVSVLTAIASHVEAGACDDDLLLIQTTNAKGKRRKVA